MQVFIIRTVEETPRYLHHPIRSSRSYEFYSDVNYATVWVGKRGASAVATAHNQLKILYPWIIDFLELEVVTADINLQVTNN